MKQLKKLINHKCVLLLLFFNIGFSQDIKEYRMISEIVLDKSKINIISLPEEMIYNKNEVITDSIVSSIKKDSRLTNIGFFLKKGWFFSMTYSKSGLKLFYILTVSHFNKKYSCKIFFKEDTFICLEGVALDCDYPQLYFSSKYGNHSQNFSLNIKEKIMNLHSPTLRWENIIAPPAVRSVPK